MKQVGDPCEWRTAASLVFDLSSEPMLLIDQGLIIGAVNDAMASMSGASHEQLVGRSCLTLLNDRDGNGDPGEGEADSSLRDLLMGDRPMKNWPASLETASGAHRFIVLSYSPFPEEGGGHRCGLIVARPASPGRPPDWLPADLFAALSHDLRTPLTSIKGCASLLLMRRAALDEERVHEMLRIIDEQADRMRDHIDNLGDLSRIGSGTLHVRRQAVPVVALIERVVGSAASRGCALAITGEPEHLRAVNVDARRIERSLLSLIEAMSAHARSGDPIALEASECGEEMILTLAGSGRWPLDPSAEAGDQRGGQRRRLRLQLALARGVVAAHGGHLWVKDGPEGSTVVKLSLPTSAQSSLPTPVGQAAIARSKGRSARSTVAE